MRNTTAFQQRDAILAEAAHLHHLAYKLREDAARDLAKAARYDRDAAALSQQLRYLAADHDLIKDAIT